MIYCILSVSTLVTMWLCELNFLLSIPAGLTNLSLEPPATTAEPPATTAKPPATAAKPPRAGKYIL